MLNVECFTLLNAVRDSPAKRDSTGQMLNYYSMLQANIFVKKVKFEFLQLNLLIFLADCTTEKRQQYVAEDQNFF